MFQQGYENIWAMKIFQQGGGDGSPFPLRDEELS